MLRIGGVAHIGANDLARLLEATKFWRADVRKLVLRAGTHRVTLTTDNPFAVVDDRTVWLRAPVVSRRGELQVPVALLDALPRDSTLARLLFEPRRGAVVKVPRGGLVRSPEVTAGDTLDARRLPGRARGGRHGGGPGARPLPRALRRDVRGRGARVAAAREPGAPDRAGPGGRGQRLRAGGGVRRGGLPAGARRGRGGRGGGDGGARVPAPAARGARGVRARGPAGAGEGRSCSTRATAGPTRA